MFLKKIFPKRELPYIFKNQLSWVLVPLLLIIWYLVPTLKPVFAPLMVGIVIIGTIETIFYERKLSTFSRIISVIFYLVLLIPFLPLNRIFARIFDKNTVNKRNDTKSTIVKSGNQENKQLKQVKINIQANRYYENNNFWILTRFNLYSFAMLIIANIVIYMLPYWPYYMCRNTMSIYLNLTVILLWLYNFVV